MTDDRLTSGDAARVPGGPIREDRRPQIRAADRGQQARRPSPMTHTR